MNKILVKLYVPMLEMEYDVWIPINRRIHNVISLLVKAVYELSDGAYRPTKMPCLYDRETAMPYNINQTIKDSNIRNGSEIILI